MNLSEIFIGAPPVV